MKQSISVITYPLDVSIHLPGSKSITNRALILAALGKGVVMLENVLQSDDTQACVAALQALGVRVDWDQDNSRILVYGCSGVFPNHTATIHCHDAGTVTRFLIPLCAAQQRGTYHFIASPRMCERPLAPLLKVLEQQGAEFEFQQQAYRMPFTLKASGLHGGNVTLDIAQSSQFCSGLLLAAPLAQSELTIQTTQDLAQKPYVRMTQRMIDIFQHSPELYVIESDASTASYFFAIAVLSRGRIHIANISMHGLQGDVQFVDLLQDMGCRISAQDDGITVDARHLDSSQPLKSPGVVDMSGFSDTFMTVAALAVFCDTPTTLTGLAHTRLQESDRVSAMAEELNKLNVRTETTHDSMTIYPSQPVGALLSGHSDHRIAMSLSVIGTRVAGIVIDGAECVTKTCPAFFGIKL